MAENEPIKYSDLISPDDSLEKLVKQLDEISSALQLVQKSAVSLNESMKTMSGATSEGRGAIAAASKEAEKLAKAQADLAFAESETARKIAELKEATREQNNLNKLAAKEANSAAGSYNALSAQYSRLKMILNQMSEEERKNTAEGRKMVKQAEDLYAKMNELQKATGKYTLQVGNYELASKSLRTELKEVTTALQQMKLNGQENTKEYQEMIARAGELKDAMNDTAQAINKTASDTATLDAILGGASAVTGGFGLAIGAMSVLGVNTESVEKAQKKLQEAIALVNSVQAISNALNKDSALMTKLRAVAQKLLNKTMEENAVATNAATTATNKWKIALMTTGIGVFLVALGALVALIYNYIDATSTAAQKQMIFNQQMENAEKKMNNAQAAYSRMRAEMAASGATAKELAQADKDHAEQMEANAKAIADARTKAFEKYAHQYNVEVMQGKKHSDEEKQQYQDLLKAKEEADEKYKDAHSKYVIASYNLDNAIEEDRKKKNEENQNAAEQAEKERIEKLKKHYSDKIRLLQSQIALEDEFSSKSFDLQKQLIEAEYKQAKINGVKEATASNEKTKKLIDLREKWANHEKEMQEEALKAAIDANTKEIEARTKLNKFITSDTDEDKANKMSIFQAILDEEQEALDALDALYEYGTKEYADALKEIEDTRKKRMKKAEKDIGKDGENSIFSILGFDLKKNDEQKAKDALNKAFDTAIANVNSYVDSLVRLKQQAVDTANAQVDSAQKVLDAEIEARNAGYANNVETAQKELQLAKKRQKEAEQEAKKAQQAQQRLDSLQQASSLVTASAELWKSLGGIPTVGPALAMAAIATMWGSFAAAKIKASQVTKEKYGEGTVELLSGGSHASGNDIDLGTKADGTRRRAEGGEFFAVINKRNSRKYRKVIPDVIRSINNDTFASKYLNANGKMAGALINIQNTNSTDLRQLQDDVRNIKTSLNRQTYVDQYGNLVEKYNGYTRKTRR